MGIRLHVYALSDGTIESIAASPGRLDEILSRVAKPAGDLASISPLVNYLRSLAKFLRPKLSEGANISIDKAWHGLHYLLSGTAWDGVPPLNFLLKGGVGISDDEGSVEHRLYTSRQVQDIRQALISVDIAQLQARVDPEAFVKFDIYPHIQVKGRANAPSGADSKYYIHHFLKLKEFISRAAIANLGVVTSRG